MDDLKVINVDPITRVVTLAIPNPPEYVSGLMKLVQIVVLALLNSPASNATYYEDGSGLPQLIGQYNMSSSDPSDILSDISERVEKVKEEIISHQTSLTGEDPSERLTDFSAVNIEQGVNIDSAVVEFRVISEGGDVAYFAI